MSDRLGSVADRQLSKAGYEPCNILANASNREIVAAIAPNIGCQNLHSCRSLQRKPFWRFGLLLSCDFFLFMYISVSLYTVVV
ncbi:hypothetical protein [Nostoc sp. FACHB-190]|uniref:hypothetical protein n=1 Tax=Nostoc sp. FACHB-190 TaxID=2692838 RepID=UPI0016838AA6|nr:hypothetical protein [Nostoc sp. FACHB-190]MBD2303005.1 hypothetical protein [Nostoc sp. FACHB-190]